MESEKQVLKEAVSRKKKGWVGGPYVFVKSSVLSGKPISPATLESLIHSGYVEHGAMRNGAHYLTEAGIEVGNA